MKIILLFTFLFGCQISLAFDEASVSIENQVSNVKISKDGSYEYTSTVWLKALNDTGRTELAVQKMTYDPSVMDVKVFDAGVDQDGKTIRVPRSQIHITDISAMEHGISKLKSIEIPFSGVKTGGVVWYTTVRKKNKPDKFSGFAVLDVLGFLKPEVKGTIQIRSALPLEVQSYDPRHELSITEKKETDNYEVTLEIKKPVYSIKPSDLTKLSREEIRDKVPRALVAPKATWEEMVAFERQIYDKALNEPLPPKAKEFVPTLVGKSKEEQVEAIFLWLSENLTYSGRWLAADSGFNPRRISEILDSGVGDCKDFALLTLAFLKELHIVADPVYVGSFDENDPTRFLKEPIDPSRPLPTMNYFNHVVVRYQSGSKWYTVDPGRNLGDSVHTPYFLNHRWSLPLASGVTLPQKLEVDPQNYGKAMIASTLKRKPDGDYSGQTKVEVSGEFSNFLKSIYFSLGEQSLHEYLNLFAASLTATNVTVEDGLKLDRSSKPWHFTLNYIAKTKDSKDQKAAVLSLLPPHLDLIALGKGKNLQFPSMPITIEQNTRFQSAFLEDEVAKDCIIRGPALSLDRRVENGVEGVEIKDSLIYPMKEPNLVSENDREAFSYHLEQLKSCLAKSDFAFQILDRTNLKQTSFESGVDTSKPFAQNESADHSNLENIKEIRRIETYLKKSPRDLKLLRLQIWNRFQIGYLSGDECIKEYLLEAEDAYLKLLPTITPDAPFFFNLGMVEFYLNNSTEALKNFHLGYKLNPKNHGILLLGAKISLRNKNYQNAVGYYAAAVANAESNDQRSRAVYKQADVMCYQLKQCQESLPLVEKSIEWKPKDAWTLYNAARIYQMARNFQKSIELNRQALSIMDFGAARSNLVEAILEDAGSKIRKTRIESDDLPAVEKNLLEAYRLEIRRIEVLDTLVFLFSIRAQIENKTSHLDTATQYASEMRSLKPDKTAIYDSERVLAEVSKRLGRNPAGK